MVAKKTSATGDTQFVAASGPKGVDATQTSASIGRALRRLRAERNLTIRDLGSAANLSAAMISRLENGQVSPSLSSLEGLAAALNVPLVALFSDTAPTSDVTFVKSGGGLSSQRLSADHLHDFQVLSAQKSDGMTFDAAHVRLERDTSIKPPSYFGRGHVLIHVLSGEMVYSCAQQMYEMGAGDTLSFGALLQHGVSEVRSDRVEFLAVTARPA